MTYVNFKLFLTLEESYENIYSPSSDHIYTLMVKRK